jgi:cbb3-type cytochrome oxidase maturation protein
MTSLAWLVPAALTLGLIGLAGFLWALRSGQFDDLEGAGWRVIDDQQPDKPASLARAKAKPVDPDA